MNRIKAFFSLIDIGHTLFGLPFAYLGACLAAGGLPGGHDVLWITSAMIGARTAALCLNRLIDYHIDKANPRTAGWVLPSGRLSRKAVGFITFLCLILLFFSAARLNNLCFKLAPLAVVCLYFYSFTKRFTWWCHFILGAVIGLGPIGGYIGVAGIIDGRTFLLGMAVATWIAGFDIMYACQDIEFDRANGLYSIPARFGERGALRFSAAFHILAVIFMIGAGAAFRLSWWYYTGVAIAALVLAIEHRIVRPGEFSRVNLASFGLNRYVSLIILIAALIDMRF
ncbi:MAG: putative 4-hydroxybenzoate polyprenyltransferase [Syntrophomonadaceae bacterium]|nr:putative 4-hydroxybenzoate polyprenyltransferase [Syntrophomonadaceae bacterium]